MVAADPLPTCTATSANFTCFARASASLCTATVSRPNARAEFMTLHAISPLFATRRRLRLVRAIVAPVRSVPQRFLVAGLKGALPARKKLERRFLWAEAVRLVGCLLSDGF